MNDKKKKVIIIHILFSITTVVMLIALIYFSFQIAVYKKYTQKAYKNILYCSKQGNTEYLTNDTIVNYGEEGCYEKMYHLLLPKLLVYRAKRNNKTISDINKISFIFTISDQILKESDAVMSYGVGHFIGFETLISSEYKIPVYLFDCGISDDKAKEISSEFENIHVQNECLGTDKYLMYKQQSSHKIHSFAQKLKELNLEDKKVFLKLGIPEIQEYIKDILKHKDNITGIAVGVDFRSPKHILDMYDSLDLVNRDFVLISRNSEENIRNFVYPKIKYAQVENPLSLSLLYVNKKYIDRYYLPFNQSNYKVGYAKRKSNKEVMFKKISISPIVVLFEKIRLLKNYLRQREYFINFVI